MCKVEITYDELFTIYQMCNDYGFEYALKADLDKVEALRVRVRGLIEEIIGEEINE
jgi:hypothetical protein